MTPGSARAVAAAVAARRIRATDAVREALARIERLDPPLNSVVAMRADDALAEAAALDAALEGGARPGPLCGVPVLVKDLEDVAGMRTTQGSALFRDAPLATGDSLVPRRLRAAGAIVVGKANLPEFATEGFTDNLLFGPTRNPWAPDWSPGGSSGGSAAALAAGLVPVATATDGGGSIRIPAAFCGLVGLKPTHGLIGRDTVPDWIDLSTYGPLAASVADVRLLLRLTSGPVPGDPDALPYPLAPLDAPVDRLYAAARTAPFGPLPVEVAALFEDGVRAMADLLGLPVRWLAPEDVFPDGNADMDWFTLTAPEHVAALGRDRVLAGLPRMHPATAAYLGDGLAVPIDEYLAARRRRFGYVRRLDDLLGTAGLLLTPTMGTTGFLPDGRPDPGSPPGTLPPPDAFGTPVQNITGHPALSVPAGRAANGVPFGLQLTGPRWSDDWLLDIAERWELAHAWPLVAPGYEPFEPNQV